MDFLHYGALAGLAGSWLFAIAGALLLACCFAGAPAWCVLALAAAACWTFGVAWWLFPVVLLPLVMLAVPPLRTRLLSRRILRLLRERGALPAISDTERAALAAGTVWLDGELFSGRPSLVALAHAPYPELTAEEQAFLDGPVEQLCAMTDDWRAHQERDLPPEVWDFCRRHRLFGMVIGKEYGGLGMSPSAHSAVVAKLASRSLPLAITVMVPNSLGPAELLTHYGTKAQQQRWLPALAEGREIPCFALTEPGAGSDAGAISSSGVVFRGEDGRLWLRLSWDKRYITLAAVATVLGLAFQLHDPENLLGKGPFPGITCALIPTRTPGVVLGRRHDPLGVPFYNCPTSGRDVLLPLDEAVIGGAAGAGRGWAMLMECLAAGRGVSLPATATGGARLVLRTVSAYAAVRQQFGLPIGRFEGIQEPLARIAGFTWLLEALRRYVAGALDGGQQPAVVTAIAKYQATELWRRVISDGMDIVGGAGIARGPRNLLAHAWQGTPICITVEGANILTRTLMIFGQGAIRCHPYAFRELDALARNDAVAFDRAFWPHLGHVLTNVVRTAVLGLTGGLVCWPPARGIAGRYYRRLDRAAAEFALLADVAMGAYGGDLKRKEAITGRFADWFGWLFLASAGLRRFAAEGSRRDDEPLLRWTMEYAFARVQEARVGLYDNLALPGLGRALRWPGHAWAALTSFGRPADDRTGQAVARAVLAPGELRDRLTAGMFVPTLATEALGRLEQALRLCTAAEPVLKRLKDAVRQGRLPKARPELLLTQALEQGLLTADEHDLVRAAEAARADAIAVDSFPVADASAATRAAAEKATPAG